MKEKKEKLISIDELIARARNLGVDFGKGNPKNRLRYFVKIGIFPNAKRKTYNGFPSQGVYPESVLKILLDIDKKIKEGKSILQIKREMEKEKKAKESEGLSSVTAEKFFEIPARKSNTGFQERKKLHSFFAVKTKNRFLNFSLPSKILILILIFVSASYFSIKEKISIEKAMNLFLATVGNFKKIVQVTPSLENPEENFPSFSLEPFLTINAETIVNPRLRISQSITSPTFILESGNFSGSLITIGLTNDRTYTLPDQSGVVCLSTGNCFGLAGEITATTPTINRIAKFIGPRTITNASILDLFNGTAITIDANGNVGIGTQNPREKLEILGNLLVGGIRAERINVNSLGIGTTNPSFPLHVIGQIQASGDICTDLAGGKCLSQLITNVPAPIYIGGGGGGLRGSGTANYLPIWTGRDVLGNSILYQNGGKIGINLRNPNEILTIAGVLSLEKSIEPSETLGFGKIFVGLDGKLYFKDENGNLYDLVRSVSSINGEGNTGQITFWSSTSTIAGDVELFWDRTTKRLGIGTSTPSEKLDVLGTIKMTGFQLTTGAQEGYILTSDALGIGRWQPVPTGTIPAGVFGQTLRYDGMGWVPTSFLYNTGSEIGIGTITPLATLAVAGSGFFEGPLTIATSSVAQLILQTEGGNYMSFSVNSTSSEIISSNTLVFNSLTGELKFFNTSLKRGDKILRASIPIFKFSLPVETSSTTFVAVTKEISTTTLKSNLPPKLEGSQRKYAILTNFADNIPPNASSTWRIDFNGRSPFDFDFQGQSLLSLEEGTSHLKDNLTDLEDYNWILKVKVPNSSYKLRIFNLFLLIYDEIQ